MNARVLLVMPAADRDELLQVAADAGFQFDWATTCHDARRALRSCGHAFDVVITDLTLCDGNWLSVYQDLTVGSNPAEIIVVTPRRGANVDEIKAYGVHSVLGQPLDRDEVIEAITAAAAHTSVPA